MLIKDAREMESGMAKITALIFSIALLFACSDSVDDPIVPPRNWESSDYVHKTNNTEMSYLYCPVYDRKFDTFKTHLMEIESLTPANIGKWSFIAVTNEMNSRHLTAHDLWDVTPVSASTGNYYAGLLESSDTDSYTGWAYLERSKFCGIDLLARIDINRNSLDLRVTTEVVRDISRADSDDRDQHHPHFTCDDIEWHFRAIGNDVNAVTTCKIVPDKASFDQEKKLSQADSMARADLSLRMSQRQAIKMSSEAGSSADEISQSSKTRI